MKILNVKENELGSLEDLRAHYGSLRRIMDAYWRNLLTVQEELVLEDKYPRETLVSYRPCV